MKNRMCLPLSAFILLSLLLAGCATVKTDDLPTYESQGLWYYEHLRSQEQRIYNAFDKAARTPFSDALTGIEPDEEGLPSLVHVNHVYQAFLYDHPEIFWIDTSFTYRTGDDPDEVEAVGVIPVFETENERLLAEETLREAAQEFLSAAEPEKTDKDRAARLHDLMAEQVLYVEEAVYDDSIKTAHSAYGALVEHRAVCDGYALGYQYLLSMSGIQCVCIPGESNAMAHVWNTAFWDGEWHEIDVTWDALSLEEGPDGGRLYFDLTSSAMKIDHTRETQGAAVLAPSAP